MKKEEYLCMSIPHKIMIQWLREDDNTYQISQLSISDAPFLLSKKHKPICRPLSDLTNPITQKDYNNGEPFVPMEKLNELFGYKECRLVLYCSNNNIGWCVDGGYCNTAISFEDMFNPIQKLLEWKFDIADLISKGEAIDVNTLEINPYK